MRVVCFNVNSIRKRLENGQLSALIADLDPDVIALQETKVADSQFPKEDCRALGYQSAIHGQPAYHGVALLSRIPIQNIRNGFPDGSADGDFRFMTADIPLLNGVVIHLINGYFPQGESRHHAQKFSHKRRFYAAILKYLQQHCTPTQPLMMVGDMNIAHTDQDVGIGEDNAARWLRSGKCGFLPEERTLFTSFLEWGLHDSLRLHHPDTSLYSWFDYRSRGFEREPKRGLRIDYILVSSPLVKCIQNAGIDYNLRAHSNPSDHAPIWVDIVKPD